MVVSGVLIEVVGREAVGDIVSTIGRQTEETQSGAVHRCKNVVQRGGEERVND
jgi:hypothetical protein